MTNKSHHLFPAELKILLNTMLQAALVSGQSWAKSRNLLASPKPTLWAKAPEACIKFVLISMGAIS